MDKQATPEPTETMHRRVDSGSSEARKLPISLLVHSNPNEGDVQQFKPIEAHDSPMANPRKRSLDDSDIVHDTDSASHSPTASLPEPPTKRRRHRRRHRSPETDLPVIRPRKSRSCSEDVQHWVELEQSMRKQEVRREQQRREDDRRVAEQWEEIVAAASAVKNDDRAAAAALLEKQQQQQQQQEAVELQDHGCGGSETNFVMLNHRKVYLPEGPDYYVC